MSRDRSLDDFAGSGVDVDEDEDETDDVAIAEPDAPGTGDATDTDDAVETDAVAPATPTYRFDPDGAACDGCDEVVQKRWHDDGQFVCADCKEW
ncbi:DUF7573 domain-containing protein [Halogranum rubrum]|uniref:DUF7573 domain-containing protein n=1 Tax=Halogranum salarium B-1 TaxID=1210908 RepID=J2ZCC2_9EURY|nr:hypothetical protein [Halogranum salarium]EJN58325.1 hypothetical protein HSB1_37420 [Halogranum salarium B-1]